MKLYGAAMVRNEADIIEAFVRHNLTVLDGLAILDHDSFDGTAQILAALVAEGLPLAVTSDDTPAHHQSAMTTRLVRDTFARTGADWIFAIDADEFLKFRSRALLESILAGVPRGMHVVLDWQSYVPDFKHGSRGGEIVDLLKSAQRVATETHGFRKVVIGRDFLTTPEAVVSAGNHVVLPAPDAADQGANPHVWIKPAAAAIAHLPVRSRDQFTCKIAIGWLAHLASRPADPRIAFHWREAFADLAAGKPLDDATLRRIACNYSMPQALWRNPDEITLVDEPFLGMFDLRYTALARQAPLPLVLTAAERLLASLAHDTTATAPTPSTARPRAP